MSHRMQAQRGFESRPAPGRCLTYQAGWAPSLSRRLAVFHFEKAANTAKGDWIERYELLRSKPPQTSFHPYPRSYGDPVGGVTAPSHDAHIVHTSPREARLKPNNVRARQVASN